jgi:hypothetical protein
MRTFNPGDRVFDIRYGWGVVNVGFTSSTITVYFEDVEVTTSYDIRFASRILSFTEYTLDGHSLEKPELTWWSVNQEWVSAGITEHFMDFLERNFEPPVRKCK